MSQVVTRVGFFEWITRDDKRVMRPLPYYLVTVPGFGGRLFEPKDAFIRRNVDGAEIAFKEVNEIREYDGRAKLNLCGASPDGTDLTLHAFGGWDWLF
jgi:hypothetical protein